MSDDEPTDPFVDSTSGETTDPLLESAPDETTDPLVQSGAYQPIDREATHLIPRDSMPAENFDDDEKTNVIFYGDQSDANAPRRHDSAPSTQERSRPPSSVMQRPTAPDAVHSSTAESERTKVAKRRNRPGERTREPAPGAPSRQSHNDQRSREPAPGATSRQSHNPATGERRAKRPSPDTEGGSKPVRNQRIHSAPLPPRPNVHTGEMNQPSSNAASGQFVRRFTQRISAEASHQLEKASRSPARAMLIAVITATLVLIAGVAVVYSALAHSHLDRQLERIERSIEADLYSSHLAALRDTRALSEHRVIPWDVGDDTVASLVDHLPWLSTAEKTATVHDLEIYIQSRLEYRFSRPGAFLDELPETGHSQLLTAASIYRQLAVGDTEAAITIAETSLTSGPIDPFARLAFGDALAAGGSDAQIAAFVGHFPASTPAETYLHARLQHRFGDDDRAMEHLQRLTGEGEVLHIGARLKRAKLSEDETAIEELVRELGSPNHPHVSPLEQAQAYLLEAGLQARRGDETARRQRLEDAAGRLPLHPAAVQPLIDRMLEQGELLEARRHLSRTPSTEPRHPYFDIALGRVHLVIGDIERAVARLERHAANNVEAEATLGIAKVLAGEPDAGGEHFDAVAEQDPVTGAVLNAWLQAKYGDTASAMEAVDSVSDAELSPLYASLVADTHRRVSGLATNNDERDQRLDAATKALPEDGGNTPETRRMACLVALDQRDDEAARRQCETVATKDVAARPSTAAAIRWYLYEGDSEKARDLLETNIEESGPETTTRLWGIYLSINDGDLDSAAAELDAMSSRVRQEADFLAAEGTYLLHRGRFNRAYRNFQRAAESSPLHQTAILLGEVEAQLLAHEYGTDSPSGDIDPDGELEKSVRRVLRDGEHGPRAWSLFANLRRQQGRMADAVENIALADSARNDFGSEAELIHLLSEEIAIESTRRSSGHRRIEPLLQRGNDTSATTWRFHYLSGVWHRHQRRTNHRALQTHLRTAGDLAPQVCAIWSEVDSIRSRSLRRQLSSSHRPDHC